MKREVLETKPRVCFRERILRHNSVVCSSHLLVLVHRKDEILLSNHLVDEKHLSNRRNCCIWLAVKINLLKLNKLKCSEHV